MALVLFYEKPGCAGNARQKALLEASGHMVVARSIADTAWTPGYLLSFLRALPVAEWFNVNAPLVKSGEIDPAAFDEATALALFMVDPLLVRRPLLEVDGVCRAGFDAAAIDRWIGLAAAPAGEDLEHCAHAQASTTSCSARQEEQRHERGNFTAN